MQSNLLNELASALEKAEQDMITQYAGKVKCRMSFKDMDDDTYKYGYWTGSSWNSQMAKAAWVTKEAAEALAARDNGPIECFECPMTFGEKGKVYFLFPPNIDPVTGLCRE